MNSVEVEQAFKYFGNSSDVERTTVLAGLSLTVAPSSVYALLGASGCGKTTLLSCILGIQSLDSGRIKVLGYENRNTNETSPMCLRIGYMPQETALLDYLTVKEIVCYFGNIAQMRSDELHDRYQMLKKLLELPKDQRMVENCSGGEQRRISLACALIHDPALLILDEPTVGLDPILREKIWNFMWHATQTSKVSIIITTHYIEEARQADRCGLMRNGILLAEESPRNIIEMCQCETLEDAFFKLCLSKESELKIAKNSTSQLLQINEDTYRKISDESSEVVIPKRTLFNKKTMKALIWKNFIQTKRQIGLTLVLLLIPVLNLTLFYYAIGGDPLDLQLAVVNPEIANLSQCKNSSIITAVPNETTCQLKLISCRFLNEIPADVASMIFYKNFSEAFETVKRGRAVGVIEFFANFSESQQLFLSNEVDKDEDILNGREIKLHMDQTNLQTTLFLRHKLYESFHRYSRKLMTDCKYQKKFDSIGIQFLEPIYGNFNTEMRTTIAPPLIFIMLFITSACTTVILFLDDRRSGIWNRSILLGVDVSELILAQVLVHMSFLLIEIIEVLVVARYVLNLINQTSYFVISLFFFLLSVSGFFFGMLTSCIFDDVAVASLFYTGFSNVTLYISGILWPLEGLPNYLKFTSNFLPFTHPAIGIRDIISKGYNLGHYSVQRGLFSEIIWIVSLIAAIHLVLRFRKFSRNS